MLRVFQVCLGFFRKSCCQINSQPLNLKVPLMARFGSARLLFVGLHLQLMELQKTMLLSFCVPTKSAGRPDNEEKQQRHLNSALHGEDRGWGMEISLEAAGFFHVWGAFIDSGGLICWSRVFRRHYILSCFGALYK